MLKRIYALYCSVDTIRKPSSHKNLLCLQQGSEFLFSFVDLRRCWCSFSSLESVVQSS